MRPGILNPFFVPVQSFHGIGPKLALWLKSLCGPLVLDVLWHIPSGLKQRPVFIAPPEQPTLGTLKITVTAHKQPRSKKQPYVIFGNSNLGDVQLIFFHAHANYFVKKLGIGSSAWISGHIQKEDGYIKVFHPDYIETDANRIPKNEAIYPLKAGSSGKVIRQLMDQILPTLPDLPEEINEKLLQQKHWPSWRQAIQQIHNPKTMADLDLHSSARERLAFDELLANQTALHLIRKHHGGQKGLILPFLNKLKIPLPFTLTLAQEKCLNEIRQDLGSPNRMIRLIQGDVGSGKTIVALLAALQAIENKAQAALLAPTDILVHQHFDKISMFCKTLNIKVALLTSREKGHIKQQILSELASGKIDLLIGTHAILEENVHFHKLGLAIIDEQHRFGVKQRLALAQKEPQSNILVMSATPIPRTLALTAYGDMDISLLNEKPAGRQEIETRVLPISKIPEVVQHLLQTQTQVYWVCPLVEESEKSDLMAAQKRYESLAKVFGAQVGLVHGKMKTAEKDEQMRLFIQGQKKILVSTTVIEVGVDVPSAGVMIVEHAERFGLSTLHQLRGRVGRGQDKASCLLLYGHLSALGKQRLAVLRDTSDGFQIAEADLKLRGAGEVLGLRQSGLSFFHFADLMEHMELLQLANEQAHQILTQDPQLQSKNGQALKNMLYLFKKDEQIHLLEAG